MQKVTDRVYIERAYYGGNVGCVVTDRGPVLVDTPMIPRDARHWRDQIEQVTSLPILYVINTDYREEHILGNDLFDALVVAHELAWERLSSYGEGFWQQAANLLEPVDLEAAVELEQLKLVLPQITFTERMTLHKGAPEIRLIHLGGHTPATIAVYLPDEQVLFAGKNVVLDTLPVLVQADTRQWLEALTAIRKMRVQTLVPGQGPLGHISATESLSEYIRLVRDQVRRHFQAGRSKSELSSLALRLADAYPVPEAEQEGLRPRIKANLDRVYDEMKTEQRQK
ncbi:MAG: MBL fold metallo-hydrolase [Anaerolineae bacterium]|nr:MAG: MBL fold metallo-hydrolase [Anaerolineae bacterium]